MTELQVALARSRRALWAAFGFSVAVNILMLTVALYMLQLYDRVLTSHSTATLFYLTLLAVAALLLLGLFEVLRSRVLVRLGGWLDRLLSPSVFKRGLENAVVGVPYSSGAIRDLCSLRSFLGGAGVLALLDAPWVPVYFTVIYLLHPTLGHFAVGGAAMLLLLSFSGNWLARNSLIQANTAQSGSLQSADAAFRNAEVVAGMGMGTALSRRWDQNNANFLLAQMQASDTAGTIAAITKSFRLMLQVGILGLGAWIVLQGQLTPGAMVAASIVLGRGLAPVEQVTAAWKQVVGAHGAWGRLAALLGKTPLQPRAMALPRPKGRLVVKDLVYLPPGARAPTIKAINFAVEPGEVLAVIGPSAAGKSTLARLLVGSGQPHAGEVRLDGADVFTVGRSTFGQYIGYLPQQVDLFPGTIRENIARMNEGDPGQVIEAARMAGVHEMILRLSAGYDTYIGEHDTLLSCGQRQRVGLARSLYGNPALLVLDEPDAHLDNAGEEALNRVIRQAKSIGTTIVIVPHSPSLMVHVDKVAMLNDGQLEMFGDQGAVLARLQSRTRSGVGQRPVRLVGSGGV
jgi:ATP-binding cassette subfamily C protein/ATP-binding cassette subfamily C protein EexD